MKRRLKMERRIIEKYAELNEACKQYPAIQLSSEEDRGGYIVRKNQIYDSPEKDYAKDGFIEVFCL